MLLSEVSSRLVGVAGCLFLLAVCLGCGGGNPVPSLADVNNTNMKKLRGAYGLYQLKHGLVGPKNEEEFKNYLKVDAGAKVKLGRMGVTPETVDDIFISERDGQPFKVRYGLKGLSDHAIVFEAEGVDGKRFVSFIEPRELDALEYERLWNGEAPVRDPSVEDERERAFGGS